MSFWFESMDIYCERTSSALWSEPLNAFTNLTFILAGIHILYLLKTFKSKSILLYIMAANTIIIGVGSFLFHTFANFLTMWADVLPITILICFTFFYVSRIVFKLSLVLSIVIVLLFFILGITLNIMLPPLLNGSLVYSHALGGLILISFFSRNKHPIITLYFAVASGVFFISLCFRTMDIELCNIFPQGTHFLWHLLNATTIWLTQKGMLEFSRETAS